MDNRTDVTLDRQFAAAIGWWRDAGVDYTFGDEAKSLFTDEDEEVSAPTPASPQAAEPTVAEPLVKSADLPDDLPAFQSWWTGQDNPFRLPNAPSVAPRGAVGAPLMVLVTMPEAGDGERLLSGPHGVLVDNILRAVDVDPGTAYFASALPAHMPLPDWDALGADGLGHALARHVALARPQRVLLFGSKLPAMLGHDPAAPPEAFAAIDDIATLATFAPERLLDHARQRARLWKRLLEWTAPR